MSYKSKKDLAMQYSISVRTITDCIREMKEIGEYGDFTFITMGKRVISEEAFDHYIKIRAAARNGRPYEKFNH